MFASFFFISVFLDIILAEKCLMLSPTEGCLTCQFEYYEKQYENNLKLSISSGLILTENDCILREAKINKRSIAIYNKKDCINCYKYDAEYFNLGVGLQEEAKIANQFLLSEIVFFFESGKHFITSNDFLSSNVELFRRALVDLKLIAMGEKENVQVIIKTNEFFLFISKSLTIERVDFYGNDLNMKDGLENCNVNTKNMCCNQELYTNPQSSCYIYKEKYSSSNQEQRGLFNMEFLFDNNVYIPTISIKNINFYNFLLLEKGFLNIFKLGPFSGNIYLENITVENCYFLLGLLSSSDELDRLYEDKIDLYKNLYKTNIDNLFENCEITNLSIKNYNTYFTEKFFHKNLINLVNLKANFLMENFEVIGIKNTNIFEVNNLYSKTISFTLSNVNIVSLINSSFLIINGFSENVKLDSITINDGLIYDIPLIQVSNAKNISFNIISIINFRLVSDINLIIFFEAIVSISASKFENCEVFVLISQTEKTLSFINSSIWNIQFRRSLFSITESELTFFNTSSIENSHGPLSMFYFSQSYLFHLFNILLAGNSISSFFHIERSEINKIESCIFKGNEMDIFWKEEQSCKNTFVIDTFIFNNFISTIFYQNIGMTTTQLNLDNVFLVSNNYTGIVLMLMLTGFSNFNRFNVINNYFLDISVFQTIFDFELSIKLSFINSFIEDNGVIQKKKFYQSELLGAILFFWYANCAFFNRIVVVVSKKIDIQSGFISSAPVGGYLEILNSFFICISKNENFSYKGMILDSPRTLIFSNNSFYNLECNPKSFMHMHGAIFLTGSSGYKISNNNYQASFNNNKFYNCSCIYGGSLTIIGMLNVEINNLYIYNSSAQFFGGALLLFSNSFVSMKNLEMDTSQGNEGGSIYLQNSLQVSVTNLMIKNVLSRKNGAFYIKNVNKLKIESYESIQTTSFLNGGSMFIFSSVLSMRNGVIINSSAKEGGSIYLTGKSSLFIENVLFNESQAENAGVFNVIDVSIIEIIDCKFLNSFAHKSGAVIIFDNLEKAYLNGFIIDKAISSGIGVILTKTSQETAIMQLAKGTFSSCFASSGSCIFHLSAISLSLKDVEMNNNGELLLFFQWPFSINITLTNVSIRNCKTKSNLIFVYGVNLNLFDARIEANEVSQEPLLKIQYGFLNIFNSYFFNSSDYFGIYFEHSTFIVCNFFIKNENQKFFSFIDSTSSSGIIRNASIVHLNSYQNNIIKFVKGKLEIFDVRCFGISGIFINIDSSNLTIDNLNISLCNSENINSPSAIYYKNENFIQYFVILSNMNLESELNFLIHLEGPLDIEIKQSKFNTSNYLMRKKAISIMNVFNVSLVNCIFEDFSESSLTMKNDMNFVSALTIHNNTFRNNSGELGGALFISFIQKINITNTTFFSNYAYYQDNTEVSGIGGCIFVISDLRYENTSYFHLSFSKFTFNKAARFISTIFSQQKLTPDPSNTFSKNSDTINFFSFPLHFSCLNRTPIEIVSGTPSSISYSLLDAYNTSIFFDNSSLITLKFSSKASNSKILLENNLASIKFGILNFRALLVTTLPNSNFTLILAGSFTGIKVNNMPEFIFQEEYDFFSRPCQYGEIILSDFSCFKCPRGTYSLIDPMEQENKFHSCKSCPSNAECPGGYFINPIKGYYRRNFSSINVVKCAVQEGCLGLEEKLYKQNEGEWKELKGGCLEGNTGNMCYYCENGFGRYDKSSVCEFCPATWLLVYSRFTAYVVFIIGYIIFNCYLAEQGNKAEVHDKIDMDTLNKFIVNHSQQVSIIILSSNVSFENINIFFNFTDYLSFSNPFALTNDCLLQLIYYSKESFIVLKEIVVMVTPILFALSSFCLWIFIYYLLSFTERFGHLSAKIPTTIKELLQKISFFLLLSAYMFYALIIKTSFLIFDCMKIDDNESTTYLKTSPDLICWESLHQKYILIALPGLIIWGFSFPLFLIYILKKSNYQIQMGKTLGIEDLEKKYKASASLVRIPSRKKTSIVSSPANKKSLFYAVSELTDEEYKIIAGRMSTQFKKNSIEATKQTILDTIKYTQESRTFTFFYQDYKTDYYYWESIIFLRKFIITFVYTLSEGFPAELKAVSIFSFIILSMYFTKRKSPFKISFCNTLELFSLIAIAASVLAHFFLSTELDQITKYTIMGASILVNLLFYSTISYFITKKTALIIVRIKNNIKKKNLKKIINN